jgi:hypothetical protein
MAGPSQNFNTMQKNGAHAAAHRVTCNLPLAVQSAIHAAIDNPTGSHVTATQRKEVLDAIREEARHSSGFDAVHLSNLGKMMETNLRGDVPEMNPTIKGPSVHGPRSQRSSCAM